MTNTPNIVTIYGNEYQAKIGSYILVDDETIGHNLHKGSDYSDSGFPGCQFYLPRNTLPNGLACNVEITGRTLQRKNGAYYIKVKITWVGDCEPNTETSGWMLAA